MITVHRIGKHLGAEISGVDLARPMDDNTFAQISRAFFGNEVVVIRNQKITPEQQIAFTRRFGVLEQHVRKEHRLDGYPEILIVSNVLNEQGRAIGVEDAGRFWHSDLSYKQVPSLLSALYAIEVPVKDDVVLGNTSFASTTAAYDALPEDMKRRLQKLKNVHSYVYYRNKNIQAQREEQARGDRVVQEHVLTEEHLKQVPDAEAPIVRTHPYTGKRCLFVNEGYTTRIAGMDEAESDSLLGELLAHVTRPEFIYRHRWKVGDLLMWDNCSTQHRAVVDYELPQRRLMERTTLRGTAPL